MMWSAVLALILLVTGCSLGPGNTTDTSRKERTPIAYEAFMAEGIRLMNQREFQAAIGRFKSAAQMNVDDPNPYYLSGRSLFRMDRHEEAITAFNGALEISPNHYPSLHWRWAARLEEERFDPVVKKTVQEEIEQLLSNRGNDPGALFAAYSGYSYLKSHKKRLLVLRHLVEIHHDDKHAAALASDLLEEIIQAHEPATTMELAALYMQYFPKEDNVRIAARAWVHATAEKAGTIGRFQADAQAAIRANPDVPYLNTAVAAWLIRNEVNHPWAIKLLEEHAGYQTVEDGSYGVQQHGVPSGAAERVFLLGVAHFKQGRLDKSKRLLQRALDLAPENPQAHYYLGRLAERDGRYQDALFYFRRTLHLKPGDEDAHRRLQTILAREYGYRGDPRKYFAQREGIVYFNDITKSAGLARIAASRVAWGDYDGDGFPDFLADGARLFRNRGDGHFVEVTKRTGLAGLPDITGGVWGDYDNDGLLDLFLTSRHRNLLLKNNGKGAFVDVSVTALPASESAPSEAAAWGDLDNDGALDLYVANYERAGVERGLCTHDRLWRNLGNGRFEDITERSGIATDEAMCGRGVAWGDVNQDGRLDILVSNYRLDPNFLWMNQGNGTFVDGVNKGARGNGVDGYYGHTVGSVFGDIDNDGDTDLFLSNLAHPRFLKFSDKSMLLINSGSPHFAYDDVFATSGLRYEETSSDPALADVDNDGDLDLYITSVYPGRQSHLYVNDGKGRFTDVSWVSGTTVQNGWGAAFADYDLDGDLDLLVAGGEEIHLFRNESSHNHWVAVEVRDRTCNRFGIGARISARFAGKRLVRELRTGKGTGTQDCLAAHFGLGNYTGPVDIEVRTLCGQVLRSRVQAPDRAIVVSVPAVSYSDS